MGVAGIPALTVQRAIGMNAKRIRFVLSALPAMALLACQGHGPVNSTALIPAAAWNCGMADGIPSPESGKLVLEFEIPLDRAAQVGKTPYGQRRIAVGKEGSVKGEQLSATIMPGALDYELTLANGVLEIEQVLVLRTADGTYIYVRNAGVGPDAADIRVVMDFEAPNAGPYAWLNAGRYVARRELNATSGKLALRVYDVAGVAVNAKDALRIAKPAGVPAQPWDYRLKGAAEQPGEMLVREDVTLAPSQSVGVSKRGGRNIIPISGGTLSGRISGKVLMGGADFQNLTPPVTLDARYLWQAADGEIIIVRNAGSMGAFVPAFEARVDGPYAFLNSGRYLSSNPTMGQGGVSLTFYESRN